MSKPIHTTETLTFIPSSVDTANSSYNGVYNNNNPENGLTNHTSTTRACVYSNKGASAVSDLWYNFDCSGIPAEATIDSVTCQAGAACYSNGQYFATRTLQLYVGTSTAKGSPTTITGTGNTNTAHTLNCGTSWTRSDLDNLKLRIHIVRTTSSTSSDASFSFWGATLNITYTISGTAYTITATSSVSGVTAEPSTQDILSGGSGEVSIYASSLSGLTITDNGTDISSQLVQHTMPTGGTKTTDLGSYTLVSGNFNGSGATYFQGIVGHGVSASQTTSNYYSSSSSTIAVFTYDLDFSDIPSNATITALSCRVNGHAESTSNNNEYMCVQLISGDTELSSELNFKSIGTSNSTQTLTATTLPTVAQLENLQLKCRLGYYGGAINGATCTVSYTVPSSGNDYYWTYSISNISTDHLISIDEESSIIVPDEDPTKSYFPITVSSINATTDPGNGTTRVEAGTNQTIVITPSDPQLTLALDNGVDVTSQLVSHMPSNTYTVTTQVSGASYGFSLNSSTGYYTSNNNGQDNSAAVARVNFNLSTPCLVTIDYINYAEATYDYGIFGQIDTSLGTTYTADSNAYHTCNANSDNIASVQTLTYNLSSGSHYIDIKYRKDEGTSSNNDSLQWKISSIESTSGSGYYTYLLSDINQKHSLVFVFGDVTYYLINSIGNACKLFPDGQMVKLQGDSYRLVIVPNDADATVTLTDNGVDRTSQLQYEEGQDKTGSTVANYIYTLNNVSAAHNLSITCTSTTPTRIYIKTNGSWIQGSKVYVKENNTWVEQPSTTWSRVIEPGFNYRILN